MAITTKILGTNKARDEARKLLDLAKILEPKVPVRKLAALKGCIVKAVALDDDLSGMAFIKDGRRAIIVNSWHHPNRQRFTIAHELGHHVLHSSHLENGVHVDKGILKRSPNSSSGLDKLEIQANAFAAEILMPLDLIANYIPDGLDLHDEDELSKYAKMFGVSTTALGYRILNLKG